MGLGLMAAGLVSADLDLGVGLPSMLSALGLAYATTGYVAALAAWCGFLAVAAATVTNMGLEALVTRFGRAMIISAHSAAPLIVGLLAGAVGAGLGAWMIGEMTVMVAAIGLGATTGLAVAWPRPLL